MPIDELNSAIWLIRLYGSTIPQTQSEICQEFVCSTIGSEIHITKIKIIVTTFTNVGALNNSITELVLPLVTDITINDSPVNTNFSINPLDYFKNLPKCTSLSIYSDSRITQIPIHFNKAFPNLENLILYCSNLTSIPIFFNSTELIDMRVNAPKLTLTLPTNANLPKLSNLLLTVLIERDKTYIFTQQSYPSLAIIKIQGTSNGNYGIIVEVASPLVTSVFTAIINNGPGFISPIFVYPKSITTIIVGGPIFSYSPSDLTLYTKLTHLKLINGQGEFPFYGPLPSTIQILSLGSNNNFTGSIPSNFLANSLPSLSIDLTGNQFLQGSLGQEYCYIGKLFIQNTSISSVPDCWWCFYNYTTSQFLFQTYLSQPQNIDCNFKVESTNLFSMNGDPVRIKGEGIGWGDPQTQVIIPNRELSKYIPAPLGSSQNMTLQFSGHSMNFTVNIIGFSVRNVTIDLKSNQDMIVYYNYANPNYPPNVTVGNSLQSVKSIDSNCTTVCRAVYTIPFPFNIETMTSAFFETLFEHQSIGSSLIIIKDTIVTSVNLQSSTLNLFGYFGKQSINGSVMINNTINCVIATTTLTFINCTLNQIPTSGPATISVSVPNGYYSSSSLLFIPYVQPSNQDCIINTNNCNGHGSCVNGQCQCDDGWVDDCRLKNEKDPEVMFKPNTTSPTSSFSHKNFTFSFNLVEIQELDIDGNVIKRLESNSWLLNDRSTNDLVSLSYDLVSHQNDSDYSLLNVTSIVEFSNSSRSIQFGDDIIQLGAGSIKVSVNITKWPFTSVLSNLRVLFSTTINNQQSIIGCDDSINTIESFQQSSNDDSIQYLRVVKDNVQFFGRFIDYCLSDGRKTYSKTQLINTTAIDQDNSIALIGISLPQSQSSILDPDFSALIINPDSYGKCDSKSDNDRWKLIVGVVVGVVGAVCLSVIIFVVVKRIKHNMILNINGQVLPADQINSAIWLGQLYGIEPPLTNEDDVCGSDEFTCKVIGSERHITDISIFRLDNVVSTVTSSITQLVFPQVSSITIYEGPQASIINRNINPLDYFKGQYPKCTRITFSDDTKIIQVPVNFNQAFPNLSALYISSTNLTTIPASGICTPTLYNLQFDSPKLTDVAIPPCSYLTDLLLKTSYQSNITYRFTQQQFPKLKSLIIVPSVIDPNIVLTLEIDTPSIDTVTAYVNSYGSSYVYPIFSNPGSIKTLTIGGSAVSVANNLSVFKNLERFSISYSSGPFPFNELLSPKLISLSLVDNMFTGSIASDFLTNNPQLTSLQLTGNQLLQGSFGQESCNLNQLFIANTSISSVPDCWWCYYNETKNVNFATTLTVPIPANCPDPQLDSTQYFSFGSRVTITGSNIGWGNRVSNLYVLEANRKLIATVTIPYSTTQSVIIQFSSQHSRTVSVTNIDFFTRNVTIDLKTNQEEEQDGEPQDHPFGAVYKFIENISFASCFSPIEELVDKVSGVKNIIETADKAWKKEMEKRDLENININNINNSNITIN
ncbi:tetracycline-efflux transporter [Cavenderia fasciculata]|uniref:Tetracycline-efflux transporter n=1 Tax=Cavenderia fasciculata TaxID=261658 RepID=F4Q8B0_CACFS|nr:tetracycline-efflux transporter [Cavenderia fasciculata]EGG16010.1 tetracycline-efflux transporter [Cavenderia fasciculata]|eukprot:XP_004352335.1 tetracycline-efflux transporter [Cavenderia fasciculata]